MKLSPSIIAMAVSACFLSTNALAALTANDDTNKIEGTYNNALMRSTDNGESWLELVTSDGTSAGTNNDFPGTETVVVANKLADVIATPLYDATQSYGTPNTKVRYNGYYWTNQWWANPGEIPGSNAVWLKGAATNLEANVIDTYNFTPWQGQQADDYQKQQKEKVAKQSRIYGYYPEWGVYEAHNYFTPDKIAWDQITHLSYAFAVIENGVVVTHDTEKGPGLMKEIANTSEQKGVVNVLSVGGWTNSEDGVFESAASTPEGVEKLAQSIVDYMVEWRFNAVDIDWEYPDNDQEKSQFTSLITSLRSKLDSVGKQNDRYYQLSAAVTVNHNYMAYINPAETSGLLDSVNVMAYDVHGAFDAITGHNAPLYANSMDEDQKLNVSSAINEYVNNWNIPKTKITMGVPFYGRGWGDVEPTEKIKGLPGLFAPGSATVHGAWDDEGQYTGTNPFYVLQEKLASGDYTRYWDPESLVAYLYNSKTKEFLTYDDEASITDKVNYIKDQGLGGAIIWDISGDDSNHTLGKIVATLKDSDSDDDDDDGAIVVSYLDLRPGADSDRYVQSDGLVTFDPAGIYFELPEDDLSKGTFDVRVNNVSVAKVDKGSVKNGAYTSWKNTAKVTTNRVDIKEGDVISVVRQDVEPESLQVSKTVTKSMLGDPLLVEGGDLETVSIYGVAGQATSPFEAIYLFIPAKSGVTSEYHVYINDKYASSVKAQGTSKGVMDNMYASARGPYWYYNTTQNVNFNEGDDVKVYQIVNGSKTLVAQLTVPHGYEYY